MIHGVSYLGERDISVDTPVGELETMCLAGGTSVCQEKSFGEFVKLLADILGTEKFL